LAFSLKEISQVKFIIHYPTLKINIRSDQLISRILLPALVTANRSTIIHLGCTLPHTSCNLPENLGGQPSNVSLFGLAPDGVYQAFPVTWKTGALLPHRFTLTLIKSSIKAVYSLLHFPSRHRDSTLWSVLSCGVRTFLQV